MARFIKCGNVIVAVDRVIFMEEGENGTQLYFNEVETVTFPRISIDDLEAALRNSDAVVEVFSPDADETL